MSDTSDLNKRISALSPEKRALLMMQLQKKHQASSATGRIPRRATEQRSAVSFAQQRMWFLDQLEPGSSFYTIPLCLRLTGKLVVAALEQTLGVLVGRHEVLRTTFVVEDGQPIPVIAAASAIELPLVDFEMLPEQEREHAARLRLHEETLLPFDLARGPLVRPMLLRLRPDEHILLLSLHHIISDGWSMGIVLRELAACYKALCDGQAPDLPELSIQYADYALWQREWLQGSGVRGQESGRQADKQTTRQADKEQGMLDSQSPIPNPQSPASHPSPPPALRLSPIPARPLRYACPPLRRS